jgi:hypothetical protein
MGRYPPACCSSRLPVFLSRLLQKLTELSANSFRLLFCWLVGAQLPLPGRAARRYLRARGAGRAGLRRTDVGRACAQAAIAPHACGRSGARGGWGGGGRLKLARWFWIQGCIWYHQRASFSPPSFLISPEPLALSPSLPPHLCDTMADIANCRDGLVVDSLSRYSGYTVGADLGVLDSHASSWRSNVSDLCIG